MLVLCGRERVDFKKRIIRSIAYAARYGNQQRTESLMMTLEELHDFNAELSDIIKSENGVGES